MATRAVTPNGSEIKRLREEKGWAIDELARKAGVAYRTAQKANAGEPVGMKSLGWLAEALDTTYEKLLAGAAPAAKMRVNVVVEVDMATASAPDVAHFVELLRGLISSGEITVRHVREGSVIISLDMSKEDVLKLVELVPDLPEAAREYLRLTPEGEAYFRGDVEGPGVERVRRLLEMVDAVTELRIPVESEGPPPADDPLPDETSPPMVDEPAPVSTQGADILGLRYAHFGIPSLNRWLEQTRAEPPSPERDVKIAEIEAALDILCTETDDPRKEE